VCGTENRDEAQFCRACGTPFAAASAAGTAPASASNVCAECGFQNKPGIRYCANCGMSLAAPSGDAATPADIPGNSDYAGLGPPPISYPSFATVAPYPPAPTDHSALFEDRPAPDIPDPDAEIALRQQQSNDSAGETTVSFQNPAPPSRTPLILGVVVAALAAAGVAAWLFMGKSDPSPPRPGAASAPVVAAPPTAAEKAPIIIEEASPPSATASANAVPPQAPAPPTPATSPAATTGSLGAPPAAAPPLPQLGDPAVESAEAEAKRVAAERKRDKAARDKAEREAKAKAASEPRGSTVATPTAAQRAEQEAQARKRAEDAQRAKPSPAAAPSPPAVAAQPRGVREICAGRGLIAEAVCQSRQCGLPEHANETICRQLREQDDRRRNFQN
jgi:hypothetical protein